MARGTNIEWATATWNPWIGCRKVSAGCKNCYMFRDMNRYGNDPLDIHRTKDATFNKPLRWSGETVFVCSWSDFFIKEADEWRDEAWNIMRQTPQNIYLLLTKRPESVIDRLPDDWSPDGWPNVYIGATVESSKNYDRLYHLEDIPAAKKFVSYEPALSRINLNPWLNQIDWVIAGGESGPGYRPMNLQWARDVRNQCAAYDVPFFFKQIGGWPNKGNKLEDIPEDLRIRQVIGE